MAPLTASVEITSSPSKVWSILSDVNRWSDWTPTVSKIQQLDPSPFKVGSRFKIFQPNLRPAVWTVSEWADEQRFTWVSRNPGVLVVADHLITPTDAGCRVTLSIHFQGLLSVLLFPFVRKVTQKYLDIEAKELKRKSELH